MKFLSLIALVAAALPATVWAASTPETPPICGTKCIQQETLKSTCNVTDAACICTNVELNEKIALCVQQSCTIRESLEVQSYSKHACGAPSRDRTALVRNLGLIFLALGLFAFGLRVMARISIGTQIWGPDDWVMCIAVGMMIPLNVISVPISNVALGKDIWNVHPDDITKFLYMFYWDELLYLGALPVTKISILLFYLKIFPARKIRIMCWVLIGLNAAYFIAFELVSIFQCRPIAGAWKAWDGEFKAKCNNINMQGWMAAVGNIILDLATMILPLPELIGLSLSLKKKIQILLMFSVGFFVTIVSIVRLQSLASYATTDNATQDYVEIGYWSTIEVPVGIICASMPAIRSLFSLVFPKVFGTTQRSQSQYADISNQHKVISGSTPKNGSRISAHPGIRVKTDISVRRREVDEESAVELTDMRRECSSSEKPMAPRESV